MSEPAIDISEYLPEPSEHPFQVQGRSETTGMHLFGSVSEAFKATEDDWSIWKISWTDKETGERIRFIRLGTSTWQFAPMDVEIEERVETSRKYNLKA